jgi:hypothetical protein
MGLLVIWENKQMRFCGESKNGAFAGLVNVMVGVIT